MPDDLDDALIEQVDAVYEALLDDTGKLLDAGEQAGEMHGAAICITLNNGETVDALI